MNIQLNTVVIAVAGCLVAMLVSGFLIVVCCVLKKTFSLSKTKPKAKDSGNGLNPYVLQRDEEETKFKITRTVPSTDIYTSSQCVTCSGQTNTSDYGSRQLSDEVDVYQIDDSLHQLSLSMPSKILEDQDAAYEDAMVHLGVLLPPDNKYKNNYEFDKRQRINWSMKPSVVHTVDNPVFDGAKEPGNNSAHPGKTNLQEHMLTQIRPTDNRYSRKLESLAVENHYVADPCMAPKVKL